MQIQEILIHESNTHTHTQFVHTYIQKICYLPMVADINQSLDKNIGMEEHELVGEMKTNLVAM
jgi:hypothetical protein